MTSLAARRMARRPALEAKLQHMAQALQPLVHAKTSVAHPVFPLTIVQFWLLTDDQLDALASYYHQRTPQFLTHCYPCPVYWPREGLSIEDKRRKFGRFIGLRGCETPRRPTHSIDAINNPYRRSCRGACRMPWDDEEGAARTTTGNESACMNCSMRKISEIFMDGSIIPSGSIDVDMDVDMEMNDDSENTSDNTYCTVPSSLTSTSPDPKPLTIDDIVENAQRARLEANVGDEAMRRKTGHC